MSNKINCEACSDLRETAAVFMASGVTDEVCASLQNNTGFNPDLDEPHTDCEDLDAANDCLVGMMDARLETYDVCDWKKFMHKFIPSLWQLLKAIICAICGLWKRVETLDCIVEHLSTVQDIQLHAYEDDDPTKPALNGFRIASGVEVRQPSPTDAPTTVRIGGNMAYFTGALKFSGNMPTSYVNGATVSWLSIDKDMSPLVTSAKDSSNNNITISGGVCPPRGFLVYEYEIKACDFGFKYMYHGHLFKAADGDFEFGVYTYKKGDPIYPDCGGVNSTGTYNPADPDNILIQVRMDKVYSWAVSNGNVTPNGYCMVDLCADHWEC